MKVTFIVNKTGQTVERVFPSPYIAEKFIRKIKHSKKVRYVGYSNGV